MSLVFAQCPQRPGMRPFSRCGVFQHGPGGPRFLFVVVVLDFSPEWRLSGLGPPALGYNWDRVWYIHIHSAPLIAVMKWIQGFYALKHREEKGSWSPVITTENGRLKAPGWDERKNPRYLSPARLPFPFSRQTEAWTTFRNFQFIIRKYL